MTIDFDILFGIAAFLILAAIVLDIILLIKGIRRLTGKSKAVKIKLIPPHPIVARLQNLKQSYSLLDKLVDIIWNLKYVILNVLFIGIGLYMFYLAMSPIPNIMYSYPAANANWDNYNQPITIVFNEPVEISHLRPNVSIESLEGEWKYEKYLGILPVTRVVKFYPKTTLLPEQRVVVYMSGIGRIGVNESNEQPVNFFSQKEPEVDSTSPNNDATEVAVESPIVFHLTGANMPYDKWEFEIAPKVDFTVTNPNSSTFVITPSQPLTQSQVYSVNAYRTAIVYEVATGKEVSRDNRELVHQLQFTTHKAPLVKSFSPSGTGVKVDTPIEIVFDLDMQQDNVESAWQLTPPVAGTFEWPNDHTLIFKPTENLPKETTYTLVLPAGITSTVGGKTESAITYTFSTIGAVHVNSMYPDKGAVRVSRSTQVRINFDQEVDHNSAQSHFSISPTATGNITWEGNNLVFTPTAPFAFNTTYTISLGAGIQGTAGLASRDQYDSTFTTVPNQTLIAGFNIDFQDYDFTCGVAAAKMMLAWKGIGTSEGTLVGIMGSDTSSWAWNGSTHTWGDPNRAFLGYYQDGSGWIPGAGQTNDHPAYGALWDPIIKAYQAYGVQTELHRNWDIVSLAHTIEAGHPVQIWWYNGVSYGPNGISGETLTWVDNVTGNTLYEIEGMHSVDVIGFNGDPDNLTSFIVMDPWWGYQTYSVAKFNWQWPYLGNTGLIIY